MKFLIINRLKMDSFFDDLADRTIRGDFGNGNERKENLGCLYPFIQNRVNAKLGYSKRHPYW